MKKHLLYSSILALTIPILSHADAINVHVLSATIKDQNIANAEVILQKNGERSASSSSNSHGRATVNANTTDNADNLLIIKKSGYSTLVAKCPCDGMTYALSPVLKDLNSMRIVLNWGKNPSDLDSHLSYKNQHIYWDRKQGLEANLDVDDVDSYGPETVTIDRRLEGQYYVYSVHDFSDRGQPNTTNLSNSQAKVMVYTGESLIRSYYVPTGQTGNLWTVFRISPEGEIQDINRMSGTTVNASQVGSSVSNYQSQSTRVNIVPVSAAAQARAKTLNLNADKAYKNNQFEQASMLYQQSIDYNPNVGQTYSNLAVAYQKLNRSSEALWANQKAIALASNDNTRAYSHYNMGKIYENNQDFAQAKQHYQLANQYKPSPTYDEAIQRVSR
ncbi:YfaP family protein [Acinetobacter sp. WCHAc060025]|uniref:YfaP family protein n=1 Tax=Acinetobacter sp. WCHAc060025 TaxID=2518625 RepID=UPI00102381A9|nr:tetratricopeptide repeat protein [Acinetobacter sp. WCHAc060025]RZG76973.1 tetratricopeptide repeat protein [Acinetobacter sp. WCHAc060025]